MKNSSSVKRFLAALSAAVIAVTSVGITAFAEDAQQPGGAEQPPQTQETDPPILPYLDTTLSFEERAADLVSRMTLEEKVNQLRNGRGAALAPAIPRLGVRTYEWWSEALHGVARNGTATSFPTGLGIASTWDPELVQEMMSVTSDEARAKFNSRSTNHGLAYWSPTINLARDPRWGRAEETYGEDPFLTAQIADSFVRGLQGAGEEGDKYLKAIATVKHFAGNNSESNRHSGSLDVDERTLREYYTYAFKSAVEDANVEALMTAYNAVGGVPVSVNSYLLDTLLRRTWGFDGHVVTDCDALNDVYGAHHWKPEGWEGSFGAKETAAYALKAGLDANCGTNLANNVLSAIDAGLMSEDDMDVALVRLFTSRMRTGEFDDISVNPYAEGGQYTEANEIHATDHTQLAEDSSDEAVVLLKNEPIGEGTQKLLPLDDKVEKLVVIGDLANKVVLGDYSTYEPQHTSTPLAGITAAAKRANPDVDVTYIKGLQSAGNVNNMMNVRGPEILDNDGNLLRKINLSSNSGTSGCQIEGSGESANVGYNNMGGSWVKFSEVDFTGAKQIRVNMAGASNAAPTTLELRVGSPSGQLLATLKGRGDTGAWGNYEADTATFLGAGGGYDIKLNDVYMVMKVTPVDANLTEEEQQAIRSADAVVVYIGTVEGDSAEESDRGSIAFPRGQAELANTVAKLNPKTVAYIQSVSQMDVESFKDEVPAIFWTTYNGQAQGNAAGRLLYGEKNPSGKLPFTWYTDIKQLDKVTEYSIRSSDSSNGRTYQYFKGDVSYPFGHGLSYSDFTYSNLELDSTEYTPDDTISLSVDVANSGTLDGKAVVEAYVVSPGADKVDRPARRLKGFQKVEVAAGDTESVSIEIPASDLYYWDEDGMVQTYDQGTYIIEVGGSSEDEGKQTKTFTLSGQLTPDIKTVKAIPTGHFLDTSMPDKKIETKLSATNNDQTFVDLDSAGVSYASSDETIAKVDEKGVVTAVSGGVATITATVDGVSDSYPVVVKQSVGVDSILLDGQPLKGFVPSRFDYSVQFEDGSTYPTVTATAEDADVEITITQATDEKPEAVVVAKKGSVSAIYTIKFSILPKSFDFTKATEEELKASWTIIRETSPEKKWKLNDTGLVITTTKGDLYAGDNNAQNIFLQDASGDWLMEAKVDFEHPPAGNYQQASIMAYQDDDNYLKLSYEWAGDTTKVQFGWEIGQTFENAFKVNIDKTELWYRLEKIGNNYKAYYSIDGTEFELMGEKTVGLQDVKVGLIAINGNRDITSQDVTFKYVNFTSPSEEDGCTCVLYGLKTEGETSFGPITKDIDSVKQTLAASVKLMGACDLEGHAATAPKFTYALKPGAVNSANASIEDNQLIATNCGKASVVITATANSANPLSITVPYYVSGEISTAVKGDELTVTTSPEDKAFERDLVTVTIPAVGTDKAFKSIEALKKDGTPVLLKTVETGREYTFNMPNQPVAIQVIVTADKSDLKAVIAQAESRAEAAYTAESWSEFKLALEAARAVEEDDDASFSDVSDKTAALSDAMAALEVKYDLDTLKGLLAEAGTFVPAEADNLYDEGIAAEDRPNGAYGKSEYNQLVKDMGDAQEVVDGIEANELSEEDSVEDSTPDADSGSAPASDPDSDPSSDEGDSKLPAEADKADETDKTEDEPADSSEKTTEPGDTQEDTNTQVLAAYVEADALTVEKTDGEQTTEDKTEVTDTEVEATSNPEDITEDQKLQIIESVDQLKATLESFKESKTVVDTSALKTAIEAAEALTQDDYTDESWQTLTEAVTTAKELIDEDGAQSYSAKQVSDALAAIIEANEALKRQFPITLTAGKGGTLTSDPQGYIAEGESVTFTVAADKGYEFVSLTVNDEEREVADGKFTLENVTGDVTAQVTFKRVENADVGTGDDRTEIKIEADDDETLPLDATLTVTLKTPQEAAQISLPNAQVKLAFDFELKNSAGEPVEPKGPVTVTIKLPEALKSIANKLEVFFINGTTAKAMGAVIDANGDLVFTTTHCSTYVVGEKISKNSSGSGGGGSSHSKTKAEIAWDKVIDNLSKADDGDVIKVRVTADDRIPRKLIETLFGKDVTLIVSDGKTTATLLGLDLEKLEKNRIFYTLDALKKMESTMWESATAPDAQAPIETARPSRTNPETGGWIDIPVDSFRDNTEIALPGVEISEPVTNPVPEKAPMAAVNEAAETAGQPKAGNTNSPWGVTLALLLLLAGGVITFTTYYKKAHSDQ